MTFVKTKLFALSAISFALLTGFGPKHSSVEPKTKVVGDQLEIELLVKPNPGMKLTPEGPWSVTFTQAPGLKLDMKDGKFVDKTFDEKIPGFKILAPIDGKATAGKIDYDLRAFVCTEDKKQCFPQQHKGSFDWKKS
ncbi:MAG: hypothetical protein EOP10_11930 [Proteobacteria bacterium]|nr:MAG: hypothetical protein EOP10_11930 [Pseudomonadota bacterium]